MSQNVHPNRRVSFVWSINQEDWQSWYMLQHEFWNPDKYVRTTFERVYILADISERTECSGDTVILQQQHDGSVVYRHAPNPVNGRLASRDSGSCQRQLPKVSSWIFGFGLFFFL